MLFALLPVVKRRFMDCVLKQTYVYVCPNVMAVTIMRFCNFIAYW